MGFGIAKVPGFEMGTYLLSVIELVLAVQATTATVAGTVRDGETGAPLAGAVVVLTDLNRAAVTDAEGRYVFRDVPPGPQHLAVRFIAHAGRTLHAFVPREGVLEIHVALRPEPIPLEALEAHPRVPVRGVETGDAARFPDRGLSIAAVRNHPLVAESDVLQALGGGEVFLSPESPRGVHLRGGASDQTAYVLDGIPVFSPYHTAGIFSAWNPDALSRIEASSSWPSPALPYALSGAVLGVTRTPGERAGARGSVSTTQARLTVDGPLGLARAGYLVSVRRGFPGVIAPKGEDSYLRGETADWLAKIEAPALGGVVRLLGYDSENEIDAAAAAEGEASAPASIDRNLFAWHSRSLGAEWTRAWSRATARVLGWSARGEAAALWAAEGGEGVEMRAQRRDEGLLATVEWGDAASSTVVGLRLERSRTAYRSESGSSGGVD